MRFVAAGCLILAGLAAPSAAQTPRFDSLIVAEVAKPHPDRDRLGRLMFVVDALLRGAEPGQVTMSVAGRPISFQIVGLEFPSSTPLPFVSVQAVGWADAAADTMIAIQGGVFLDVALWRGDRSDLGVAAPPGFSLSATVSDTLCWSYRLIHARSAASARCNVGSATMAFSVLSPAGTFIASPEVTFGVARVALPIEAPPDR
jgi:hypothetical protein